MRHLEASVTPWTGRPCLRMAGAREELVKLCGRDSETLLPERVEILFDPDVTPMEVHAFTESVAAQLAREIAVWSARLKELTDSGLITQRELDAACSKLRGAQTWYVSESKGGGLTPGAPMHGAGDPDRESAGVIPCSAATHHGVAWWEAPGGRGVGLVTSRRVGGHWNWDEDIGHESAHASFGPVPLYSQSLESDGFKRRLADAYAATGGEFDEVLIARTTYLVSELMVAFVRGEQRTNGTGLPGLLDAADFNAFCTMAHRLLPLAGFDRAKTLGEAEGMPLGVWSGPTIRAIGAACFRAAPAIIPLINATHPPAPHELAPVAA
ncbi:MAG: hypothetical protein NT015_07415 [Alphaproteobacteria bacterium]|nr:hypothetical protein [Alphaproteobacteria bacterium]